MKKTIKTRQVKSDSTKHTKPDPRPRFLKVKTGVKAGAKIFRSSDPCSGDEVV